MSWNTSYVYAYDNLSGWGDRYFFTFFNEMGERDFSTAAEVTILCSIFAVSVASNIAIITCVYKFTDLRTVTNNFIVNLAVADLILALSIPCVAHSRIAPSWILGDVACKLIPYTQFVSAVVLLWTVTLISMDRYKCIVIPPYRSSLTLLHSSFLCGTLWLITSVFFIPMFFYFREQDIGDDTYICTIVFPKTDSFNFAVVIAVPVLVTACALPMVTTVFNYTMIFRKVISTRTTWGSSCVTMSTNADQQNTNPQIRRHSEVSLSDIFTPWPRRTSNAQLTGRHGSLSHHEEMRFNKHLKVVRVLFLNVVIVVFMWLPIMIVLTMLFLDADKEVEKTKIRSHNFIGVLVVAFLNTAANPIVYGVMSESFRACLIRMFCGGASEKRDVLEGNPVRQPSVRRRGSHSHARRQSFATSTETPNETV